MVYVVMVPGIKKIHDGISLHIQEISKRLAKKGLLIINVLPTENKKPNLQFVDDSYLLLEVPSVIFHLSRPNYNARNLIGSYLNQFLHYTGFKEAVRKITDDLNHEAILHTHGFCVLTQPGKSSFKRLASFMGFGQLDMLTRDHSNFRASVLHSVLKKVYSNADHYTVFSEPMKKTAIHLYGLEPDKISIVPHGVDTALYSAKTDFERIKELETKFALDKPFRIIFVGNLVRAKGLEILFGAMKILKKRRNDMMLLLKIGRSVSPMVTDMAKQLGLNDNVRVISDFLSETDFKALYQLSDTLVNFHMMTGYSTTVLEAMASGIPPIVYKNSPNRDLVDESCGILLDSINPQELADKIEMLADDRDLARKMGQMGKRKAARDYDWDKAVVPKYISLYKTLTGD